MILPLWTKLVLSDYSFKTLKGPSKKESSENFKLLGSVLSSSGLGRNSKESTHWAYSSCDSNPQPVRPDWTIFESSWL